MAKKIYEDPFADITQEEVLKELYPSGEAGRDSSEKSAGQREDEIENMKSSRKRGRPKKSDEKFDIAGVKRRIGVSGETLRLLQITKLCFCTDKHVTYDEIINTAVMEYVDKNYPEVLKGFRK